VKNDTNRLHGSSVCCRRAPLLMLVMLGRIAYNTNMRKTDSPRSRSGVWLVLGLLAIGVTAVTITYSSRLTPKETLQSVLQSRGMPAAKRGMQLSQAGRKLLSTKEQAEMDSIYAEAFRALTKWERQEFQGLTKQGEAANDREVTEMSMLIQKAIKTLPPEKSQRLFSLVERAVDLQLAKQHATPAAMQYKPAE